MSWRGLRIALACGLAATLTGSVSRHALAVDPRAESAAKAAIKRAADDYLATHYAAGAALLDKAARACGASKCAPATKAAVLRDLGTMQFRSGDTTAAAKSFAQADALQSGLTLNPDYDAPDLRAAWNAATGNGAASSPPAHEQTTGALEQPTGDFDHTPAAEQAHNTPLPVYVEATAKGPMARVVVKYKGSKMREWATLDLKRIDTGWGGLIPCGAVTVGTMRYWVQGLDPDGQPLANAGDPKRPFTVPIREEISGDAPSLPGASAPRACEEKPSECPPGSEGCGEARPHREDVGEGKREAEAPSSHSLVYARVWLGITGAADFLSLPASDDVCRRMASGVPVNPSGLYCTNPDSSDFPSTVQNGQFAQGQAGHLDGGIQAGDVRLMIAVDFALSPAILVGGRLGYVLNAYTGHAAVSSGQAFGPKVHAEGRVTYLFGPEPLQNVGFAPMAFGGVGVSEFDGHTTGLVSLIPVQGQRAVQQPVVIWLTDGPWFLAFGGGARYQFSARAAFTAALRFNAVFGGNGMMLTYGPEIGFQYGF
jgi:hypothetical protein